jgi:hypothetical protein
MSLRHRMGMFTLAEAFLLAREADALLLFGHMIVLSAHPDPLRACVTYRAASDLFEDSAEGGAIPYYTVDVVDGEVVATKIERG